MIVEIKINNDELDLYLGVLSNRHKLTNDYKQTIKLMEDNFKIIVTLEQLEKYYSPSASVIEEDYKLQYKHLGLV